MRLIKLLFPFFVLFCSLYYFVSCLYAEDLCETLNISQLKTDVYIVTHTYPWPANSLVVLMQNGDIVLLDTPYTPQAMDLILNWINKKYGKRNIVAINTHFHIDRLGGNAALVKAGIPIYGSDLTIAEIKNRGEKSKELLASWINDKTIKDYYANFKYVLPTKIFDAKKGLELHFGKELLKVSYYGAGHTTDNIVVYLPAKRLIFGGCMILALDAKTSGNVSDGNIEAWKLTLKKIKHDSFDSVVPGHGAPGGIELIKHTEQILESNNPSKEN
jgi:metallo-beta-lactamase class B